MKCDTCGKISKTDNLYEEAWIELSGNVSIGAGEYDNEKKYWRSQWINGRTDKHYFCSWKCFKDHNDNKKEEKEVTAVVCEQDNIDNGSGESGQGTYSASAGTGTQSDSIA